MFRTTLLCSALLATVGCLATMPPAWGGTLVDVDIVDRDTGQWLPETPHRGDLWVAGTPGHRYAVRLTNTTAERVLVVLSVDGVNAVTGETANPHQSGYVLAPWQSTEVVGWRKSMDDVAQFVFTDLPDSYAARTGRPRNVGVVGIAVFREARPVAYDAPYPAVPPAAVGKATAPQSQAGNAAAESHAEADAMQRQRIGTGHGQREWSQVSRTAFERATRTPAQVTELRYDDERALVAMGILPRPDRPYWTWRESPRAFPGSFVPDPPR